MLHTPPPLYYTTLELPLSRVDALSPFSITAGRAATSTVLAALTAWWRYRATYLSRPCTCARRATRTWSSRRLRRSTTFSCCKNRPRLHATQGQHQWTRSRHDTLQHCRGVNTWIVTPVVEQTIHITAARIVCEFHVLLAAFISDKVFICWFSFSIHRVIAGNFRRFFKSRSAASHFEHWLAFFCNLLSSGSVFLVIFLSKPTPPDYFFRNHSEHRLL